MSKFVIDQPSLVSVPYSQLCFSSLHTCCVIAERRLEGQRRSIFNLLPNRFNYVVRHFLKTLLGYSNILLLVFAVLFPYFLLAQNSTAFNASKVLPPPPDAAGFAKYGEIPVSLYTGVPNIEVPLYTLKSKDISIPITLSYHSGGIKVEEEAGWTGLGWSLNVGGVITRQIKGGNDLATLNDGFHGTYWVNNAQYQGYPYDPAIPTTMTQDYLGKVCLNQVDPEPDVFYFNMPGKSGSFILEKGQTPGANLIGTPMTSQKIDIKYDRSINKWVIRTVDGFTYQFGVKEIQEIKRTPPPIVSGGQVMLSQPVDEESSAYSTFYYYSTADFNIMAWYLEKIISPTNEQVTYVYDIDPVSGCGTGSWSKYGSRSVNFTDEYSDPIQISVQPGSTGTSCWGNLLGSNRIRERSQTFTSHIYLKEIQFRNGSISFSKSVRDDILSAHDVNNTPATGILNCTIGWGNNSALGPQKLDSLIIKDENGIIRKKIKLEYSYFNASNNASNKHLYKRLKLTKVSDCSSITGNCLPPYQFEYDETNPLPSKYSRALDFWGYYNGQTANPSRVSVGTYAPSGYASAKYIGDANRQPNGTFMTSGVLTKLTYPTGGYTTFQFEPNDYSIFSSSSFGITNFEADMVATNQLAYLNSTGGTTTDLVQNFTLTQSTDINVKSTLAYYPTIQNYSYPCCARNPFSGYDGYGSYISGTNYNTAEPYLEIRNNSTNALLYNLNLEQYALFLQTCTSPCNGAANSGHGAFLNKQAPLTLPAGSYKLILKQKQYWQMNSTLETKSLKTKTIPLVNGVYSKTGGGLRIKRVNSYNLSN
ncbi:MAG: hypothetical protein LCH51_04180 [Bacteroidetes bacterium]|nr:hypothetical protein [Bacteroidota bacterium]